MRVAKQNCGIGAGGFQEGNTCARGGGGGAGVMAKPSARGHRATTEPRRYEPERNAGARSADGKPSARADRALKSYKVSTAEKQQHADRIEKEVATRLGAERTGDNAPVDNVIKDSHGRIVAGVEVKTLMDNGNDKITMHPESRARKERWAQENKAKLVTVVVDERKNFGGGKNAATYSGHRLYYREGVGAFRMAGMTKASNWSEINSSVRGAAKKRRGENIEMSYIAYLDSDYAADVASGGGWSDYTAWVDQSRSDDDALLHLVEWGWCDDLASLKKSMNASAPDAPDLQSVHGVLLATVERGIEAGSAVVAISDGADDFADDDDLTKALSAVRTGSGAELVGLSKPIPKPRKGEARDEFIGRCMANLKDDYEDPKQRLAVCFGAWRKRHGGAQKTLAHALYDRIKLARFEPSEEGCQFSHLILKASPDYGFILSPILVPEEPDHQGDTVSAEEIEKAAHRYMIESQRAGLLHRKPLGASDIVLVESFIARDDMEIGGHAIAKGTWLGGWRVLSKELRRLIKRGKLKGVSIGGNGMGESLDDSA